MTRSPFFTTSALTVPCPACEAPISAPCVSLSKDARKRGKPRLNAHPTRRKAADAKRTAEVHPVCAQCGCLFVSCECSIPPEIPLRERTPPRIPDLCPDDEYRTAAVARAKATPFFPDGAIATVLQALHECGIGRKPVHVEWDAEYATARAYIVGIEPDQTDAIMSAAIPMMPLGIGIDVHVEPCVCHEQSGLCRACHNPDTCRDPACDCYPF